VSRFSIVLTLGFKQLLVASDSFNNISSDMTSFQLHRILVLHNYFNLYVVFLCML